ncbi:MAG: hypothetical protein NE328_03855 [Lentisphaeraceae bacterium]|nr:hypothetical protein [Lentisphaeraceae bacterium]
MKVETMVTQIKFMMFFENIIDNPIGYFEPLLEDLDFLDGECKKIDRSKVQFSGNINFSITDINKKSGDNRFVLHIDQQKISLFYNPQQDNTSFEEVEGELCEKIHLLISKLQNYMAKIKRVALVGSIFYETDLPNNVLKKKFLSSEIEECEEIEIRYNKKLSLKNVMINRVYKFVPVKLNMKISKKESLGVILDLDINTDLECSFDYNFVHEFIDNIKDQFKESNLTELES